MGCVVSVKSLKGLQGYRVRRKRGVGQVVGGSVELACGFGRRMLGRALGWKISTSVG